MPDEYISRQRGRYLGPHGKEPGYHPKADRVLQGTAKDAYGGVFAVLLCSSACMQYLNVWAIEVRNNIKEHFPIEPI